MTSTTRFVVMGIVVTGLTGCASGTRGGERAGPPPIQACTPGVRTCADGVARTCGGDAKWIEYACDPIQGMVCAPEGCSGACTRHELASSYVGCDYWPTATANPVWSAFHYGVAVASTTDLPA